MRDEHSWDGHSDNTTRIKNSGREREWNLIQLDKLGDKLNGTFVVFTSFKTTNRFVVQKFLEKVWP